MAPAGQVWATITDLATYAGFLLDGHPDVLSAASWHRPSARSPVRRPTGCATATGCGFQLLAGGSGTLAGHTGSMPGFLAACLVDRPRRTAGRGARQRDDRHLAGRARDRLLDELERCEPAMRGALACRRPWCRPSWSTRLGVWHWGNTAVRLRDGGHRPRGAPQRRASPTRFAVTGGRVVGTSGYHAGEELHVVRREDGSVEPPRRRDLHLHPDPVRPRCTGARGTSGSLRPDGPARCAWAYWAWDTLDMLKSGTRRAGIAVREK